MKFNTEKGSFDKRLPILFVSAHGGTVECGFRPHDGGSPHHLHGATISLLRDPLTGVPADFCLFVVTKISPSFRVPPSGDCGTLSNVTVATKLAYLDTRLQPTEGTKGGSLSSGVFSRQTSSGKSIFLSLT